MTKIASILLFMFLLLAPLKAQEETPQPDSPTLIVGGAAIYLRAEPDADSRFIALSVRDVRLPITGISEDGNYYQVVYEGETYWARVGFRIEGDLSTLEESPAAVARAFFQGVFTGEGDIARYLCYSNAEAAEQIQQGMDTLRRTLEASGAEVDVSGMTFTTTRQAANAAQVEVGGTIKFTVAGTEQVQDYPRSPIPMVLEEDGWKICG